MGVKATIWKIVLVVAVVSAHSTVARTQEFRGLDERVQGLKERVLELNRDLFVLEEELLFPATTQVAVFLSMDVGELFRLDAVKLEIDNEVVTHYLYTEREVDALFRGGVQRLYTGNLRVGKHELVAVFTGSGPRGREYRRGATLLFEKETGAKFIELKIMDDIAKKQPQFVAEQWDG